MTSFPGKRPGEQTGQFGPGGPAVAFARGLHTEMLATNQNLINRAQVLLSLNGAILGLIGAGLTGDVKDLRAALKVFEWWIWVLLSAAGVTLIASIGCCAWAMASTHWLRVASLRQWFFKAFVARVRRQKPAGTGTPLQPEYMWFFKDIAAHVNEPEDFIKRAANFDERDEVRARLQQALNMAPNVRRRARRSTLDLPFSLPASCSLH